MPKINLYWAYFKAMYFSTAGQVCELVFLLQKDITAHNSRCPVQLNIPLNLKLLICFR